jgi:hypothetical protein
MLLIIALAGTTSILFAERVTVGKGFGWDGIRYGQIAMDFYHWFSTDDVSAYSLQRIMPSAIVHYGLRALAIHPTIESVITGFAVYNLTLILLSCLLWIKIADQLRLGLAGRWLGFAGLFVNFAILKQAFYYAVLTDVSAFTLGLLMLYLFLTGRVFLLFLATLAGAFTWPVVIYAGLPLMLFRKRPVEAGGNKGHGPALATAALLTALVLWLMVDTYFFTGLRSIHGSTPVLGQLVYLSIAVSCLCFFFATKTLIGMTGPGDLLLALRSVTAARLILPLLAFIASRAIIGALVGIEGGSDYARNYLQQIALLSIAKPFVFIVAHAVYFGPAVILMVLLWDRVSAVVRQQGAGMVLFFLMSLFLGLNSESRQLIFAYPFFVAFLVKAVEPIRWGASFYWAFGAVALVMSKFWLRINTGPLEGLSPQEFPLQYYFLNHGPWMTDSTFLLQAALVSLITLLFATSLYSTGSWRNGVANPSLRHNDSYL